MPTYEYVCRKCGHQFEVFQSMSEKPLQTCPKDRCLRKKWGKGQVQRCIGAGAGLIFKGSGFYITDYRSENYKTAAKQDTSSVKSAETKTASTTSDSKPKSKESAKSTTTAAATKS